MKRFTTCLFAFFALVVCAALSPPPAVAIVHGPSFFETASTPGETVSGPVKTVSAAPEVVSPPGGIASAISDSFIPSAHAAELAAQADENPPLTTAEKFNLILGALFAVSELLALTPLKSNSIFQLIVNIIQAVRAKKAAATS